MTHMAEVTDYERLAYQLMKGHPILGHSADGLDTDNRIDMAQMKDRKVELPPELSFSLKEWDNLKIKVDPSTKTLWYYMKPQAAPSFTPGLLNDLIDFRNTIQTVYHRTPADQKLLYLVSGSGLPGIYNLGGDLGYFAQHIRSKDRERLRRYAHDCIDLMYSCASSLGLPIILISLVQGDALGGGFEVALSSDIIIAERSAKFGLPEILFNLFPGMGAYSFLSRKLDPARAMRMITSGKVYSAEELQQMGLVELVVDDGKGEEAVKDYIAKNTRKHAIHRTIRDVGRRVNGLTYEELRDVVDLWVDAAMNLDEQDLRKIERLRAAQAKRIGLT